MWVQSKFESNTAKRFARISCNTFLESLRHSDQPWLGFIAGFWLCTKLYFSVLCEARLKESNFPCMSTSNFPCNEQINYVRLPSPFRICDNVLNFEQIKSSRCHGVVDHIWLISTKSRIWSSVGADLLTSLFPCSD